MRDSEFEVVQIRDDPGQFHVAKQSGRNVDGQRADLVHGHHSHEIGELPVLAESLQLLHQDQHGSDDDHGRVQMGVEADHLTPHGGYVGSNGDFVLARRVQVDQHRLVLLRGIHQLGRQLVRYVEANQTLAVIAYLVQDRSLARTPFNNA